MALIIQHKHIIRQDGHSEPKSWAVANRFAEHKPRVLAVSYGYARKLDAECVKRGLELLDVDWELGPVELITRLSELGYATGEDLQKYANEFLLW